MAKIRSRSVEVPASAIDLAQRRTEFLFRRIQYSNTTMPMILASAYLQGMNDMFDALEARGLLSSLPNA